MADTATILGPSLSDLLPHLAGIRTASSPLGEAVQLNLSLPLRASQYVSPNASSSRPHSVGIQPISLPGNPYHCAPNEGRRLESEPYSTEAFEILGMYNRSEVPGRSCPMKLRATTSLGVILLFLAGFLPVWAGDNKKSDPNEIGNRRVAHRSLISEEHEIAIGKEYASQIDKTAKILKDPVINEYV